MKLCCGSELVYKLVFLIDVSSCPAGGNEAVNVKKRRCGRVGYAKAPNAASGKGSGEEFRALFENQIAGFGFHFFRQRAAAEGAQVQLLAVIAVQQAL